MRSIQTYSTLKDDNAIRYIVIKIAAVLDEQEDMINRLSDEIIMLKAFVLKKK
jgi:hypothetical protein